MRRNVGPHSTGARPTRMCRRPACPCPEQVVENFARVKVRRWLGIDSYCRECRRVMDRLRGRKRRAADVEKRRAYQKAWRFKRYWGDPAYRARQLQAVRLAKARARLDREDVA